MQLPPDEINERVGECYLVSFRQRYQGATYITHLKYPLRLSGRFWQRKPMRLIVVFDDPNDEEMMLYVDWSQIVEVTPTQAAV